uniref:NB-ARC domain-containing protein n=1 Tax=Oryza barthii TaxID=65489 RepID=A0A0D3HVS0_9ORYZ
MAISSSGAAAPLAGLLQSTPYPRTERGMEAVVCASHGVIGSLLWKLSALLSDEYNLLTGVKSNIIFLKAELESIDVFLKKMYEFEDPDEQSMFWMKEFRELSYDIEDIIDASMFSLGYESNRRPRGFKGFAGRCMDFLTNVKTRHWIAKKIHCLKCCVIEASNRHARYKVDGSVSKLSRTSLDPRLPAFYTETTRLVGIDGPRDKLIKMLVEEDDALVHQLKVVSIVGFGGLGKTTHANEVCRKLEGQFKYQAFVSVSQKPDIKKILRHILSQICWRECISDEAWDEQQLIHTIRQFLKDKRCFIVIDDIWSTSAWRTIKCAFPENNCSSRILTTTRIITVAKYCCSPHHDNVYEIKPLGAIHSKSLFFKQTFGSEDKCPLHLKEVSNAILRKCGGLPLGIITVASLLANKASTKEEWESIHNSIGSALEKDTDMEEMKRILLLSYDDLPYHLKTCLLYLSIFPEDYEIKRDRLIRRWIAEGFIPTEGVHDMEEVGECYFNDLINRSMILPVNIQYDGRADACRVHDMILDLIISISVKENFVTLHVDQNYKIVQQNKVRRLSLNYHAREDIMIPSSMIVSHVRSLTIFGYAEHMPPLSKLQFMRVLDLENKMVLDHSFLKHIHRLSQLKYLRLNKLVCLRVNSLELPEGIGNLQALQELSEIEINHNTSVYSLQELGNLKKLRILGLNWSISDSNCDIKIYADNLVTSLCKLGMFNLRSIQIQGYHIISLDFLLDSWFPPPHLLQKFEMSISYFFPRIPKWIESLEYLSYLDIYINPVDEETFQILAGLPSLIFLWISSRAATPKKGLIISCNGFQCLRELYFTCWESQTGMMFEAGAMPNLEKLRVPYNACDICSLHGGMDFGIQHLCSLKHLHVEIICRGAKLQEVEALENAIKSAAGLLSDELTFEVSRWDEEEIIDMDQELAEDDFDTIN